METDQKRQSMFRSQSGATAIEFAFVFPILFAIIYGTITYGYVYFLQQRINFAVEQGLRAAIAADPGNVPAGTTYDQNVEAAATTAIANTFTLGGGVIPPGLILPPAYFRDPLGSGRTLTIVLSYSLVSPVLFPTIALPGGVGTIPPLPDVLMARATGRL